MALTHVNKPFTPAGAKVIGHDFTLYFGCIISHPKSLTQRNSRLLLHVHSVTDLLFGIRIGDLSLFVVPKSQWLTDSHLPLVMKTWPGHPLVVVKAVPVML